MVTMVLGFFEGIAAAGADLWLTERAVLNSVTGESADVAATRVGAASEDEDVVRRR